MNIYFIQIIFGLLSYALSQQWLLKNSFFTRNNINVNETIGWSSNVITNCYSFDSLNVLGGLSTSTFNGFGEGTKLTKNIASLPNHYKVKIYFSIFYFEQYQNSTSQFPQENSLILKIDGNQVLAEDFPSFADCFEKQPCNSESYRVIRTYQVEAHHTSNNLTLTFIDILKESKLIRGWGIRDVKVYLAICNFSCLSCSGNLDTCSTCIENSEKTQDGKYCKCLKGYYTKSISPFECQKCHQSCKSCSGVQADDCTSCRQQNAILLQGKCVCQTGYYLNQNNECQKCHSFCRECAGPSNNECLSCFAGGILQLEEACPYGQCLCPIGYIQDNSSQFSCVQCNSSCMSCNSQTPNECTSCTTNSQLNLTTKNCQCQSGYYPTLDKILKCLPCNLACLTCDSYNHCLICKDPNATPIQDSCSCKQGYYQNPQDGKCVPCSGNCQLCSGDSSCTLCVDNSFIQNGTCNCLDGYYPLKKNDTLIECLPCHSQCLNCIGPNSNQCISCMKRSYLFKLEKNSVAGSCECNDFLYPSKETPFQCLNCHYSCLSCKDSTENSCLSCFQNAELNQDGTCSCKFGHYFDQINKKCLACGQYCRKCDSSNPDICLICSHPLTTLQKGKCVVIPGYYPNTDGDIEKCYATCYECMNGAKDDCSSCKPGLILVNGECICPPESSLDLLSPNLCVKCSKLCKTCSGIQDNQCIECYDGYIKSRNGKCVCNIHEGWVQIHNFDPTCVQCHPDCKTCEGIQSNQCLTCKQDQILENGSCICPEQYYQVPNSVPINCLPCDVTCKKCYNSSSSSCSACYEHSYLFQGNCLCNVGYYYHSPQAQCLKCKNNCLECETQDNNCTKCFDNATLIDGGCICNDGYTFNENTLQCEECSPNCLRCLASDKTICSSCTENSVLVNNKCECISHYYEVKESQKLLCLPCDPSCESCIDSGSKLSCYQCADNFQLYKISTHLITKREIGYCECQAGYFRADDNPLICTPCNPPCKTCSGSSNNCLDCLQNQQLINGVCECPARTFRDQNLGCYPCHSFCKSCFGPSQNECSECIGTNISLEKNSCICDRRFTMNQRGNNCISCSKLCFTCKEQEPQICTSCINNFILDENGNCNCPLSFFQDVSVTPNICSPCNSSCKSCFGINQNQCYSCTENATLTEKNTCICKKGYFNSSTDGGLVCQKCSSNCQTCKGSGEYCLTCNCNQILDITKNFCFCQNETYLNSNGVNCCFSCNDGCSKCNPDGTCLKCQSNSILLKDNTCSCLEGYYLQKFPPFQCQKCNSLCLTCFESSNNDCLTCQENASLVLSTCECNQGYFLNNTLNKCQACSKSCSACYFSENNCTDCPPNSSLVNGTCVCFSGYFQDANTQTCLPCNINCLTCQGNATYCTSCVVNALLKESTCFCAYGYYEEKIDSVHPPKCLNCLKCDGQCSSCYQKSSFCLSCSDSLAILNKENGKCSCPSKFFKENSSGLCQQCNQTCKDCFGPLSINCNTCNDNAQLSFNNECLCKNGFFYNFRLQQCDKCSPQCQTCSESPMKCTSCTFNAQLSNYVCQCSKGFFQKTGDGEPFQCLPCINICSSCIGAADRCFNCKPNATLNRITMKCVCEQGFYQDIRSGNCIPCCPFCRECIGPNSNDCTQCYPNSIKLTEPVGTCQCALNSYTFSTYPFLDCRKCDSSCASCSQNPSNCESCPVGVSLNIQDHTCTCTPGRYLENVSPIVCTECDPKCLTCKDSITCTSCKNNANLVNNECICNEGFVMIEGICNPCNAECKTCTNSCGECTSCFQDSHLDYIHHTCLCNQGTYRDNQDNICKPCNKKCDYCDGSANQCSLCPQNSTLIALTQQCECNNGYYFQDSDNTCQKCDVSCETCKGPKITDCLKCKENIQKSQDGKCLCQENLILDQLTGICSPCYPSCTSCSGTRQNNCLTCQANSYLNGYGECLCSQGYFKDPITKKCSQCNGSCLSCLGPLDSDCSKCQINFASPQGGRGQCQCLSGYSLESQDKKVCVKCNSSCLTCQNFNQNACINCKENAVLQPGTNQCNCYEGFFFDSDLTCSKCNNSCLTCSGDKETDCLSCDVNYKLVNGTCICQDGFYFNSQTNTCESCSPTCKTCDQSANNCLSCNNFQMRIADTYTQHFQCQCISGYFIDPTNSQQTCLPCHSTCKECTGPSNLQCAPCVDNASYAGNSDNQNQNNNNNNSNNRSCVCDMGFFTVQTIPKLVCSKCRISNCIQCSNQSSCILCDNGYKINVDGTCIIEDGKASDDDVIITCHPTCKSCDIQLPTKCLTCYQFSVLDQRFQCICLNGYYRSQRDSSCLKCADSCSTCNGPQNNNCLSCPAHSILTNGMCICQDFFVFQEITQSCIQCSSNCLNCEILPTQCTSCQINAVLNSQTKKCECVDGYFFNSITKQCTICDPSCLTCNGKAKTCTSCLNDSVLINDACECKERSYRDICAPNICTPCDISCQTCSSQYKCDTCILNLIKVPDLDLCIPSNSKYPDISSSICHPKCRGCYGPNFNNCLSCYQNAHFNKEGLDTCDCDDQYSYPYPQETNSRCVLCSSECSQCRASDQSFCTQCKNGSIPNNGRCLCSEGYYTDSEGTCQKCDKTCKTCTGANQDQCLVCANKRVIDQNSKLCGCPNGTYLNKNSLSCELCHPSCNMCSGPFYYECISCPEDLQFINSQCGCKSNQYLDPILKSCQNCSIQCLTCTSDGSCDSCIDKNAQLSAGQCICLEGFLLIQNQCVKCDSSCKTCNGINKNQCLSCHNNQSLGYDNTCSCQFGYFRNPSNIFECIKCDATCLTCKDSATTCLSCLKNTTLLNNKCQCNESYYMDSASGVCFPCKDKCRKCLDNNTCIDCLNQQQIIQSELCICPIGTFFDQKSNGSCMKCHSSCSSCSGPYESQCLTCLDTLMKIDNQGKCTCKQGYFNCLGVCQKCADRCLSCSCSSLSTCSQCIPNASFPNLNIVPILKICQCDTGYYYDKIKNTCEPCHFTCSKCKGPSFSDCTVCSTETVPLNKKCICKPGLYPDLKDQGRCKLCHPNCSQCSGPNPNDCISCLFNSTLQNDKTCKCNLSTFRNSSGQSQCLPCQPNCQTCVESFLDSCTSCRTEDNFYLSLNPNSNSGRCLCIEGYQLVQDIYNKGYCRPCHQTCLTCNGTSSTNCLTCPKNSKLLLTGKCQCLDGFFLSTDGKTCKQCHSSCQTCGGPNISDCLTCTNNAVLSDSKCFCQNGYYFNSIYCIGCSKNCLQCSLKGCSSCEKGFILNQQTGECQIAAGYFILVPQISLQATIDPQYSTSSLVIQCHPSCLSCTGPHSNECSSCYQNANFDHHSKQCLCNSRFFLSSLTNKCHQCPQSCEDCFHENIGGCNRCMENSSVSSNGYCTCNEGYKYSSISMTCEKNYNQMTSECSSIFAAYLQQSKLQHYGQFDNNDPVVEIVLDHNHSLIPQECSKYLQLSAQISGQNLTDWTNIPSSLITKSERNQGSYLIKLSNSLILSCLKVTSISPDYFALLLQVSIEDQQKRSVWATVNLHINLQKHSLIIINQIDSLINEQTEQEDCNQINPNCFLIPDIDTSSQICEDITCSAQRKNLTFFEGEKLFVSIQFLEPSFKRIIEKRAINLLHEGKEILELSDSSITVNQTTSKTILSFILPKQADNLYLQILAEIQEIELPSKNQEHFLQSQRNLWRSVATTSADFTQLSVISLDPKDKYSSGSSLKFSFLLMILLILFGIII